MKAGMVASAAYYGFKALAHAGTAASAVSGTSTKRMPTAVVERVSRLKNRMLQYQSWKNEPEKAAVVKASALAEFPEMNSAKWDAWYLTVQENVAHENLLLVRMPNPPGYDIPEDFFIQTANS